MNFSDFLHTKPVFERVAEQARKLDIPAYVVGGYVRDLVLKRPSKDIDIVCLGSGIALAEAVGQAAGAHVAVYQNFGTAMLRMPDPADGDVDVEFVGARKESYRADSRKPIVEDGTLQDDQNRRDLTINAMSISLNAADFGALIDPFDGLGDLKRRIIRTPLAPDITFSDDPLRMMRAIRFATQLNFDIDPDTFDGIVRMKDRLPIVSMERVIDELNKIILAKTPSYGFKLLYHAGLLELILPELTALKGVETVDGKGHKDNFYHTLQVLDNVAGMTDDLWVRWAALLHDIAKTQTKRFDKRVGWTFHGHEEVGARQVPTLFRRLKLPLNEHMKQVQKLVRLHMRPIPLVKEGITDSALRRLLFDVGPDLEALLTLCRADITSKNHEKVQRHLQRFDQVEQKLHDLEERDQLRNFQPVITGELIMETFNLKPSKLVGELKVAVREAILEGMIPNQYAVAYPFMIAEGEKRGLTVAKYVEATNVPGDEAPDTSGALPQPTPKSLPQPDERKQ
ncbi:polynucleotide adenylyltransferase/metal dependent phosphohydrolase [Fibrella aestuarina BUZ 2]|uniref:Polynucleotide adenylyltransferase/metal dependent phosphohydrolase n=1 Tax=Fibrella aestuarina BUZ 2 TaxID=1166018 RepID=I0KAL4_9BACT|nr:HD domain-containing protein [Fibrella aestuarina]CCH01167.1 polynucleotide adenylyltransferase/metal dependent phosphohydrolase [Fibrella aestuarina BUZ 2]